MLSLMRPAFVIIGVLFVGRVAQAENEPWSIDTPDVTVGGCITISLSSAAPVAHDLRVKVGDMLPIPLEATGSMIESSSGRHILVFQDMATPQGVEEVPGEANTLQFLPLFREPGDIAVTLLTSKGGLGTRTVHVAPADDAAQRAISAIYPKIVRDRPCDPDECLWMEVVVDTQWGGSRPIEEDTLAQLHASLPVVAAHPDWGPLLKELVTYREAQAAVHTAVRVQAGEAVSGEQVKEAMRTVEKASKSTRRTKVRGFGGLLSERTRSLLEERDDVVRRYLIGEGGQD